MNLDREFHPSWRQMEKLDKKNLQQVYVLPAFYLQKTTVPPLKASIVKNSSVEPNSGRLCNVAGGVLIIISSTTRIYKCEIKEVSIQHGVLTNSYRVLDIFHLDDITEQHATFLASFAIIIAILVKNDSWRVNDTHSTLELDRLQVFRMARLGCDSTYLNIGTVGI